MTQTVELATSLEVNGSSREVLPDSPDIDLRQEFFANLAPGCTDCGSARSRSARNIGTFVGERITPSKALTLVDERVPCRHIEITDPLEQSSVRSAWHTGRAVLARANFDSEGYPVDARGPRPSIEKPGRHLYLSEVEAQVVLIGLAHKSGEIDGQPVAGGRKTPSGFVPEVSIKADDKLTESIIAKLTAARQSKS